jgi:hypothetical protein
LRKLLLLFALICFAPLAHATGAPPVQTCNNRTNAGTTTCVFGSNITAGNLVAVYFSDATNSTATVSSVVATGCSTTTFTVTPSSPAVSTGVSQGWAYVAPNSGGGCTTITVTFSGTVKSAIMGAEYAGMATSSPVDCDAAENGITNSGTVTSGSCSSTNANDTIFIGISTDSDCSPSTAGGSYTKVVDTSTGGSFWSTSEDLNVSSTGSQSGSMSMTAQVGTQEAMLVALKQASASSAASKIVGPSREVGPSVAH